MFKLKFHAFIKKWTIFAMPLPEYRGWRYCLFEKRYGIEKYTSVLLNIFYILMTFSLQSKMCHIIYVTFSAKTGHVRTW